MFFLFFIASVFGQNNRWIDFSNDYYRIPTATNSIHRLSFTTLSASGVPISGLDPRDIRVFHRGQEVAVHVEGQDDGVFDAQDFVELIGMKNDATLDRELYENGYSIPNPYYNTHNDTTVFFLTVTPGVRGKRMQVRGTPAPTTEVLRIAQRSHIEDFSEQYSLGRTYFPGVRLSTYDLGQGWTGATIVRGNSRIFNYNNLGAIQAAPAPKLEVSIVGRSDTNHRTSVQVGPSSSALRELGPFDFRGFETQMVLQNLTVADFSSTGNLVIRVASLGQQDAIDNVSVNYIRIDYGAPVLPGDFDQQVFYIPAGVSKIQLAETTRSYLAYDVSNMNSIVRHAVSQSNGMLETFAGKAGMETRLMIQSARSIVEPNVLQRVRFRNLMDQPADFIIVTHPLLERPAANYGNPVQAYAAHRASPVGGGYDTLTVTIDQLYNQFSYGEKNPLAMRDFLKAYYPRYKPEHLLLIGRAFGIYNTRRSGSVNYYYRNNPSVFSFQELVPTFGYPYSDNQFTVGLDPLEPMKQDIAVGRLPARIPEDVANYLDKIKEKEALGVQEDWQKNILHLSGGRSAFELERFYNFLNSFKAVAEGIYLGGSVATLRKRTNATVELINVSEQVNEGVSLVTFFGHAAPSVTDVDIGFASVDELNYRNKGKYPVLLLNGCDAGNAFGAAYTFGEDWINTPDRGASNFLAHADIGIDVYLRRYSESFYAKAFADSALIHQPVGIVKIASDKLMYSRYGFSEVNRSHADQMIMLGDPAVKIFPANKADYAISGDDVQLSGLDDLPLSSLLDSMRLSIVVRNIGRVDLDSIEINVKRQLPDGTSITYDTERLAPIFRKDTLFLTIANVGINAFGDNVFTVEINKRRHIDELTYANNTVIVSRYVPLSGTLNLNPIEFSIVNSRQVEFITQIPGKSIEERNLVIQLDTAANFSSAARREVRLTTANLGRWNVDLFREFPQRDSLTFYWRTRFMEPKEGENADWTASSFSFIRNGPKGWTQRRLPQFVSNRMENVEPDLTANAWKFQDSRMNVDIFTFGPEAEGLGPENNQVLINGVAYILDAAGRFCPGGSLGLLAFEEKTLQPYLPVPLTTIDVLDGKSCGRSPQIIQNIRNQWITQPGQTMLIDYINNLGEGDYVFIFSVGNVTFSDWPDAVILKMKEVGANEATLRNLKTGDPYILVGRKGLRPGDALEILPDPTLEDSPNAQILTYETTLNGFFPTGSILSPLVGPSSQWVAFFNRLTDKNLLNPELATFDLIGVDSDGGEVTLISAIQQDQVDLSLISPEDYPYLRLRYRLDDEDAEVPVQLQRWQVNYTGVPEGVLVLRSKQEEIRLFEGQESEVEFDFYNISTYDFPDSITVEWSFNNLNQRRVERFSKKIPAVKAGQKISFAIPFASRGKAGKNSLNVFANPRIHMEQWFRNNTMDLPEYFLVEGDDLNPVLDVHFDGMYIMDGDIVSPNVLISTIIKDENIYSFKKDTVGLELMIKRPCEGCDFERVSFSNPQVQWFEATAESDFKIEFQPGPLEDGVYTLRVNASDASGNKAGEKPYEVNFEVINESQITNFYPFPNPFSTSVRFVFTVTGAEVPDEIKIQIMTVTGKVVREIFQDELGPVRIGNNLTEYAWDGRDEFGDQLANGVYIYRVLVRKNGQFLEHRPTAGDKAFKKGYGKMYLLR